MPKTVTKDKNKTNIGIAIFTLIAMGLPVLITLFTGVSSFKNPYGIYALTMFGIGIYFSCIYGMFAWKNKVLFIAMNIINLIASIGFVIYSYINYSYSGGLLLHISAALLFIFGMYITADADQGDSFINREIAAIGIDIAGLIFVLWFINVKMNVIAHIVIVSIINFFSLAIYLIPTLVKLFKTRDEVFDDIENDELEYEEETEEEMQEKKEEKKARIEEKKLQKAAANASKNDTSPKKNTSGKSRRFCVSAMTINSISKHLTKEFNRMIDSVNGDIENNNYTIKHSTDEDLIKNAVQSNKEIKLCVRRLRRFLKGVNKNLAKLGKVVFTEEDMFKKFTYDIAKGKLKKIKGTTDIVNPSIRIMRYYARGWYTLYKYTKTVEVTYDGEDDYAREIR